MDPYYCPHCGARMYPEDLNEWACFICGERLFFQSGLDRLIQAVADQAEKDRTGRKYGHPINHVGPALRPAPRPVTLLRRPAA
jgi:hypothetical protein